MPTNLPPEYFQIDKRYRAAESTEEKIALLEELLGTIPKHKGTEKLRGEYKGRLAKLRDEAHAHTKAGRKGSAFQVEREGAGQVVLVGCANSGKSSLLRALTHAEPEVSAAPFTTWEPMPGMVRVEGVPVQLVDTPPLDAPFVDPELFQLIRHADLALLVVDITADPFQQVDFALSLLNEHHAQPPMILLVNKCDDENGERDCDVFRELIAGEHAVLPVSALSRRNLDRLGREIVSRLDVVRVYARPPGKDPDFAAPFVVKAGATLEDLGAMIHKDFVHNLKHARVWGKTVRDGQMVSRDYVLQDGDIVEMHVG